MVGVPVKLFSEEPRPSSFLIYTTPTEVVVVKAAKTTAPTISLVAIDILTPTAVAAVAIVPAPTAADVPANEAAWTAMD
jgi:hypothetical protein